MTDQEIKDLIEPYWTDSLTICLRGLPGAGKTTLISQILKIVNPNTYAICSADDYFKAGNQYLWIPALLGDAHKRSAKMAVLACEREVQLIIIDNTNIKYSDMDAYEHVALDADYILREINLFDGGMTDQQLADRNTHKVPIQSIERMRRNYEQ